MKQCSSASAFLQPAAFSSDSRELLWRKGCIRNKMGRSSSSGELERALFLDGDTPGATVISLTSLLGTADIHSMFRGASPSFASCFGLQTIFLRLFCTKWKANKPADTPVMFHSYYKVLMSLVALRERTTVHCKRLVDIHSDPHTCMVVSCYSISCTVRSFSPNCQSEHVDIPCEG